MAPSYNGNSVPVWPFRPNWRAGLTFTQGFRTTVREALDTSEHRAELYPRPLYGLQFAVMTKEQKELAFLKALVETLDDDPIAMPVWHMRTQLTVSCNSGATSLTVDTVAYRMFDVFTPYALLWSDPFTWEVVEIATASGTAVTLAVGTVSGWSAGASLIPLMFGFLKRPDVELLTDEHGDIQIQFQETFNGITTQNVTEGRPADDTIPFSGIYDTFEGYTSGQSSSFNKGAGWDGAWELDPDVLGEQARDEMDAYTDGQGVSGGAGGEGFSGGWSVT